MNKIINEVNKVNKPFTHPHPPPTLPLHAPYLHTENLSSPQLRPVRRRSQAQSQAYV